jgi:hypothetical protein
MPRPGELSLNHIGLELYRPLNLFREFLTSGLFPLKMAALIRKGNRAFMSPAISEQTLEGISVFVDKGAVIKFATNPMAIETIVVVGISVVHVS